MRNHQAHHQRCSVPAAGDQATEWTPRRRHRVRVHRLWVVAPGKFHDLVGGDRDLAEFTHHADMVVLEIPFSRWNRSVAIHGKPIRCVIAETLSDMQYTTPQSCGDATPACGGSRSLQHMSRRGLPAGATAVALGRPAIAQGPPLKIGLMLPFSGTFAALGENIAAAFELYLQERDGKLGGRAVTVIRLDDESDPAKAPQNVNRLLDRDHADVLIGTVHSGVG